ncbi:hypothetical protein [Myxococcus sp. CA040A]|uniref:hypothetical protein n=1 Tax=Myxococcus sp. CA040A TaxID=2741738 RepID=UPI00157B3F5A|nr:hypothetical protein [Myxococcus sp. CA040A]NTX01471.1 hypothetical protein [Myxococcus sp. CA040A]
MQHAKPPQRDWYHLGIAVALLSSGVAAAETVTLECAGTSALHYEPGLTNTPQQVSFTSNTTYGPCLGIPLGIASGTSQGFGSSINSCTFASTSFTHTITWNDSTTSVIAGSSIASAGPAGEKIIVANGVVVSGRFQGAQVVRTLTLLNTDLLGCFTPEGVSDVAGPVTLTVVKLL